MSVESDMNLHLPRYREVKDKYCVCYFGPCNEYITILLGLRKQAEDQLPGIQLYIGCRDDLCTDERTLPESIVTQMIREPWGTGFGHIREIRCDMVNHPVAQFFTESKIAIKPVPCTATPGNRVVRLYPRGTSPTKSLTEIQIKTLTDQYTKAGYIVHEDGPWQDAGLVVGVECVSTWAAALAGQQVALCDSGLGTDFFRVIHPWTPVISV